MIDTVLLRVAVETPLSRDILQKFRWRNERYYFRDTASLHSPCHFYYPSPDGKYYLSVEASLPKILFGHNIAVLTQPEIIQSLLMLSNFATANFGIDFDALQANVARVDFCVNFDVGADRIYAYLRAATEARPQRLKRRIIGKIETVEFFNEQRKIYLYDKARQTQFLLRRDKIPSGIAASAVGLIRLEARFSNPVVIQRLIVDHLNLTDRAALTILDSAVAKKVLSEALIQFELDKPIIKLDRRVETLQKYYGYGSKLQQLLGFMQLCDLYGQDNLINRGIIKRSSFYQHIKDLRRAGALIYTTYHSPLEALSVECVISGKDTRHSSATVDSLESSNANEINDRID